MKAFASRQFPPLLNILLLYYSIRVFWSFLQIVTLFWFYPIIDPDDNVSSLCSLFKKRRNLITLGKLTQSLFSENDTSLFSENTALLLSGYIGHQACHQGYKTHYFNTQKLFPQLKIFKADGSYLKQMSKIEKQDLLILDDFGLQPLDNNSRMMLLEIIEDQHGRKSTIIASQLPIAKWYEVIGDSTIADAILYRLIHSAQRIELKGESLRKIK